MITKNKWGYLVSSDKILLVFVEDVSELTFDWVDTQIQILEVSFIHLLA